MNLCFTPDSRWGLLGRSIRRR